MASKRMFSIKIMDSDAFLGLPQSAQALYIHLNMRADDDGFIGNAKRITPYVGASAKDLQALVDARFLLEIDNVHVIKHWRIHNTLCKDRYAPTTYQDEYKKLTLKDNKSYTECIQNDNRYDNELRNKPDNITDNNDVPIDVNSDIDKDIDLDKDINNISCASELHETDLLEEFYESIWTLYPIKKGKGQVSKTKKQVLQRIGYEEMKRCVERFVSDMGEKDKQYWMHGSTFYNGGYVDYLDCNYQTVRKEVEEETPVEEDRFAGLDSDFRQRLEKRGIINGNSFSRKDATDEEIKILQEAGAL